MTTSALTRPAPKSEGGSAIAQRIDRILPILPRHVDRDRFAHAVIVAANALGDDVTGASVLRSAYNVATLGLMPGAVLGLAYFLPFGRECQLVIGYRGWMELARRSRTVADIHAEIVYQGEPFRVVGGTDRAIHHEMQVEAGEIEPTEIRCAYATWRDMSSGQIQFRVCPASRIARARKASRTANAKHSPWTSDEGAMVRKTAILHAHSLWPVTPELAHAAALEYAIERHEPQPSIVDADDVEPDKRLSLADLPDVEEAPTENPPARKLAAPVTMTELVAMLRDQANIDERAAAGRISDHISENQLDTADHDDLLLIEAAIRGGDLD